MQLRITRAQEYYVGSARVGFQGWIKIGFAADGRITASDVFIVEDIGANATGGDASSAGGAISLVYHPDAMRFRGLPVLTNTTPRGAQRGPGQNQIAAVMAPIMDKAAKELGIDRVEIRKINATNNDTLVYADREAVTSAYMNEALDKGADDVRLGKPQPAAEAERQQGARHRRRPGLSLRRRDRLRRARAHHPGRASCTSTPASATSAPIPTQSTSRAAAEVLKCDWDDCEIHRGNTDNHLPWNSYQVGSVSIVHADAHQLRRRDGCARQDEAHRRGNDGRRARPTTTSTASAFSAVENAAQGMSYGAIAARAIQLGGEYSGRTPGRTTSTRSRSARYRTSRAPV